MDEFEHITPTDGEDYRDNFVKSNLDPDFYLGWTINQMVNELIRLNTLLVEMQIILGKATDEI